MHIHAPWRIARVHHMIAPAPLSRSARHRTARGDDWGEHGAGQGPAEGAAWRRSGCDRVGGSVRCVWKRTSVIGSAETWEDFERCIVGRREKPNHSEGDRKQFQTRL